MRLKNKKTGEIVDLAEGHICETNCGSYLTVSPVAVLDKSYNYTSLTELNEEWEDYEDPKEPKESKKYWFINSGGKIVSYYEEDEDPEDTEACKEIGNYFDTREEADLAVRKLKAWKRLRDNGFRFTAWKNGILLDKTVAGQVRYEFPISNKDDVEADLDLLFGGGE